MCHGFVSAAAILVLLCGPVGAKPQARTFRFTYAATVSGLKPGQTARVWVPVPPSTTEQDVTILKRELPAEGRIARAPQYGNRILSFEAKADASGEVSLRMVYKVTRREVQGGDGEKEDAARLTRFLKAEARVPVGGKTLKLLEGVELPEDPLKAARVIYDAVNRHMRYSKEGTGWGNGDAVWACENGRGNCSDFHSLFLSLARWRKIPAKFEIGFPLPAKHGRGTVPGYHCWAKFHVKGKGWVPVDISEANKDPKRRDYFFGNLDENRVLFSTGRDLELVPRQAGKPLNCFIYPYVEVGGKTYSPRKVRTTFSYQDL